MCQNYLKSYNTKIFYYSPKSKHSLSRRYIADKVRILKKDSPDLVDTMHSDYMQKKISLCYIYLCNTVYTELQH